MGYADAGASGVCAHPHGCTEVPYHAGTASVVLAGPPRFNCWIVVARCANALPGSERSSRYMDREDQLWAVLVAAIIRIWAAPASVVLRVFCIRSGKRVLLPAGAAGAAGTRPQSEETGRDARASLRGVDDSVASRVILWGKEAERWNLSADAEVKSRAVHRELRIRSKS